ncbi:MAG: AraC family transcriptional regulator ligand-binding domain-containing protein [Myxococcota bacterium]
MNSKEGSTLVAGWTRTLVRCLSDHGIDPDEVMCAVEGTEEQLLRTHGRIRREVDDALWDAAARVVGHESFGIYVATKYASADSFGLAGLVAMSGTKLSDAVDTVERLGRLVDPEAVVDAVWEPNGMRITTRPTEETRIWSRHFAEALVASWVVLARNWTGTEVRPLAVYFQHSKPADLSGYEMFFGCPVHFDMHGNGVLVSGETLSLPLRSSNQELRPYLLELAEQQLESFAPEGVAGQARDVLRTMIRNDDSPRLAIVARRLGVEARTLQRRLAADGTTFQEILDEVRREEACKLLAGGATAESVAKEVGFADSAGFRRAFRRWTGMSPRAYRSAHRRP